MTGSKGPLCFVESPEGEPEGGRNVGNEHRAVNVKDENSFRTNTLDKAIHLLGQALILAGRVGV
jgi:hypothetical protein